MNKRICPKCKSTDIEIKFNKLIAVGAPQPWKCKKCGFTSFLFPEEKLNRISKKK